MTITEITGPAKEPVDIEDVKAHAVIEDDGQDGNLLVYIESARETVEEETRRQLVEATYELLLDAFPCEGVIKIPRPPLLEVVSIKYLDTGGTEQTWDPDEYVVDAPAGPKAPPGTVRPAFGALWPFAQEVEKAVRVRFRCGYLYQAGDPLAWTGRVPAKLRHAIMVGAAEGFKNREETVQGTISTELHNTIARLVGAYVVKELDWA